MVTNQQVKWWRSRSDSTFRAGGTAMVWLAFYALAALSMVMASAADKAIDVAMMVGQ